MSSLISGKSSSSVSKKSSSSISLLSWSSSTWKRWSDMPRMYTKPIPRTKFVLLKAPVSTLYEEKLGGDRYMFTVGMYADRCTSKCLNVTLVMDLTSLDLHKFDPPTTTTTTTTPSSSTTNNTMMNHNNNKYFHNVQEWEEYGMDYQRLSCDGGSKDDGLVFLVLKEFIDGCMDHWKEQPSSYIAVYDSRGGWGMASYFIACYMCQVYRAPVHVALASLATLNQTSCGICDLEYIQDLQIRYKGRTSLTFDSSLVPSWFYLQPDNSDEDEDENEDDNNDPNQSKEQNNKTNNKKNSHAIVTIPPFRENSSNHNNNNKKRSLSLVVGVEEDVVLPANNKTKQKTSSSSNNNILESSLIPLTIESSRYIRAATVWKQLTNNNNNNNHPTTTLVPLTNPQTQMKHPPHTYKITWNPVGRHGYLLILLDGSYFLEPKPTTNNTTTNNNNNMMMMISQLQPPIHVPSPTSSKSQHRTLLQVVLVNDKDSIPRFMIQDILVHNGGILTGKPWKQRLAFWMEGVLACKKKRNLHKKNQSNYEPWNFLNYHNCNMYGPKYVPWSYILPMALSLYPPNPNIILLHKNHQISSLPNKNFKKKQHGPIYYPICNPFPNNPKKKKKRD